MDEEYSEVFCHKCKTNFNKLVALWSHKFYQEMYQRVEEEYKMKELLRQSREELELLELKKKVSTSNILDKRQNVEQNF